VQVALKVASKALGFHGVFKRGKGRKYLIADSALKPMQVDAPGACWLDANEHHAADAVLMVGVRYLQLTKLSHIRLSSGRRSFHKRSLHECAALPSTDKLCAETLSVRD